MMEGKLYGVCTAAYRDRQFYGGYSELAVSTFVSVKTDGLRECFGTTDVVNFWQLLYILRLARKICNIRHTCTLVEISKTR